MKIAGNLTLKGDYASSSSVWRKKKLPLKQ